MRIFLAFCAFSFIFGLFFGEVGNIDYFCKLLLSIHLSDGLQE